MVSASGLGPVGSNRARVREILLLTWKYFRESDDHLSRLMESGLDLWGRRSVVLNDMGS